MEQAASARSNSLNAGFLTAEELSALDFACLGKDVLIHSTCVLVNCRAMSIGDGVRIDPFATLSASHSIRIGRYVHVAAQCVIMGSAPIVIDDFAGLSHGARILSASDDFQGGALIGPTVPARFRNVDAREVRLERHAVVGSGTVVLPGCVIGEGATVGALSLVNKSLQPWSVYLGNPARRIGPRDRDGVLAAERAFLESLSA